ncbi:SDR family NAD(P)-dependent oxidoreductase [Edaphobacter aggregans]|uniref:SDR family NAD(P)-dependent oxidoreductase n=1 Tax=Edaphobacter aggregans TaxID=570835 RepID=UPI00054E6B35|nr:glucose 1-dehydrogenase [Edaphobacter aggregans]
MSRLSGKIALVTGASKGIGAGIARAFATEGASVVVNYASSAHDADKVVTSITNSGGKAIAIQANISNEADVQRLFAETQKTFGRLDILVNNAGVYGFSAISEFTAAEYHRQFNTNVLGLLFATREAIKLFPSEGGAIINIGSAVSATHPPKGAIYTATKAAVDSITQVLSKELGPRKIRVNSINPGLVETEGTHTIGFIGGDWQREREAHTPLGRTGQASDIAPVAVFLASDDARWITGELIIASGGLR